MSAPAYTLRPYQHEARDAVLRAVVGGVQRPAVVLPTGAGKTVVISDIVSTALHYQLVQGRVLAIAHRKELIEQMADKIKSQAPHLRVGILKGDRREIYADVVVGSVQTVRQARNLAELRHVGLGIVDECHHAAAASYRKVMEHYAVPWVGFTATMSRGDGLALGEIWSDVVYTRSIAEMIRDGFLVRPRGVRVQVPDLDLRKVKRMHGDYSEKALGEALEGSLAPAAIARAWREHAALLQGILFAPTVHSAEVIGEELARQGFTSALVHGAMPDAERGATLQRFREGQVQILVNCMVLTEGTDLPMASVVAIARPTTNTGLYVQMVGRGLRLWPGKREALVLDLVGASQKHSIMSPVVLFGDSLTDLDADLVEITPDAELDALPDPVPAAKGDPRAQKIVDGDLESFEVDLFHSSDSAWQRTDGGHWFIPAGGRFIAIVPSELVAGGYDVVWMSTRAPGPSGWVRRGLTQLGEAMSAAESGISDQERLTADRERAWRKRRRPNEKQVGYAKRLGIEVHEGMTEGLLSAAISQAEATRRIDRVEHARVRQHANLNPIHTGGTQ